MTETSRLRTDSPSESLSPVITTSITSPNTTQPSSDDKFSQAQASVDSRIMEQDHTRVSEEYGGGGFDPNGHYQNVYMSISESVIGNPKAQSQQPIVSGSQGTPASQNNRCNAHQYQNDDGEVRRSKRNFQKHDDNGDAAQDNGIGRARRDMGYPGLFQGNSDEKNFDTMDPMEMAHRGHGSLGALDSPFQNRNFRGMTGQYEQEQHDSRSERYVLGRHQMSVDSSDDFGTFNIPHENEGRGPHQSQRVALVSGHREPRFSVATTAPVVKGRIVKQTLRRGDPKFIDAGENEDAGFENSEFQYSSMDDEGHKEHDEYVEYSQVLSPEYDTSMVEDEQYGEDQAERIFVSEPSFHRPNRVEKNRAGVSQPTDARPIANITVLNGAGRSHPAVARRNKNADKSRIIFNTPSKHLAPSRYSGAVMPWGVNQQPVLVDQETVSDAHLKKRGLTRPPPGEKVVKRSYGANDPENVAIVNMKENDHLSFAEIAEALNLRRVECGRAPSLTVCGVNGRYKPDRKKAGGAKAHGSSTSRAGWTAEAENRLVEIVKQVEAVKWTQVAKLLNADLYNGQAIHDAAHCAKRYAAL
ncbi:hypothetical protein DID88_002216 [Monilinia fructigena]|uniref:Myb-like domain-containing protein n=1 Tax=Monilinia fructigena TaxID=38457 RepID=A0A395IVJ6_9HELO|nr:hypothetical protein DID88_002216 [Monilinia fructigena]